MYHIRPRLFPYIKLWVPYFTNTSRRFWAAGLLLGILYYSKEVQL